jgi:hypothetical protein
MYIFSCLPLKHCLVVDRTAVAQCTYTQDEAEEIQMKLKSIIPCILFGAVVMMSVHDSQAAPTAHTFQNSLNAPGSGCQLQDPWGNAVLAGTRDRALLTNNTTSTLYAVCPVNLYTYDGSKSSLQIKITHSGNLNNACAVCYEAPDATAGQCLVAQPLTTYGSNGYISEGLSNLSTSGYSWTVQCALPPNASISYYGAKYSYSSYF